MKKIWLNSGFAVVALASVIMLSSCDPKEHLATPSKVQTVQMAEGSNYATQFFFNLDGNITAASGPRDNWDLAFQSTDQGFHVYLNSAKFMFAYSSGSTVFDSVFAFSNAKLYTWVDQPSGNPDSTAIGIWEQSSNGSNAVSKGLVYLIDRGKTSANAPLEKRKMRIIGCTNGVYNIEFANLDGTDKHTVQITTDGSHSFGYLSFDNSGAQVTVAPAKDAYDLQFTMYTHVFDTTPPGIPIAVHNFPYLLNGVLLNPNTISVSKDTVNDVPFDSVTLAMAQGRTYSKAWNTIGYDWKTFDFNDENYTIAAHFKYFIKTSGGKYYKLRFTDFYDKNGVKGYPTFQYQLLQ